MHEFIKSIIVSCTSSMSRYVFFLFKIWTDRQTVVLIGIIACMLSLPPFISDQYTQMLIIFFLKTTICPPSSVINFFSSFCSMSVSIRTKLIKRRNGIERDKWKNALIIALGCVCLYVFFYWIKQQNLFFIFVSQVFSKIEQMSIYLLIHISINCW